VDPTDYAAVSSPTAATLTGEKADLLQALAGHRFLFRGTVTGLTDEQAASRPTVSELCLGGLIKHVTETERGWIDFAVNGPAAMIAATERFSDGTATVQDWNAGFAMLPGETLEDLLADYERAARETEEAVAALPDLDVSHPLPPAPWFAPGARWSARRVLVHIVAETAQHAGHADILREAIDGQKSMG
jgi:hypothetical protein